MIMINLTNDQIDCYHESGFLLLRQVIPEHLLITAQRKMEEWVDCALQEWLDLKLISQDFRSLDFYHRFDRAWQAAGKPDFRRRPNRFIISPEMYEFLKDPVFISIASQILAGNEIAVHGIFNLRPQVPNDPRTVTPMHQDGQFWNLDYGDSMKGLDQALKTHVVTYWFPLQKVTQNSGCILAIDRKQTGRRLFEIFDYNYENTGNLGLSPSDIAKFNLIPVEMERGDLLIFDQLTPHAASNNLSDHVRWSVDVRYELASDRAPTGTKFGFIASHPDSSKLTSMSDWIKCKQPPVPLTIL